LTPQTSSNFFPKGVPIQSMVAKDDMLFPVMILKSQNVLLISDDSSKAGLRFLAITTGTFQAFPNLVTKNSKF
jgi:hypothetical protein